MTYRIYIGHTLRFCGLQPYCPYLILRVPSFAFSVFYPSAIRAVAYSDHQRRAVKQAVQILVSMITS